MELVFIKRFSDRATNEHLSYHFSWNLNFFFLTSHFSLFFSLDMDLCEVLCELVLYCGHLLQCVFSIWYFLGIRFLKGNGSSRLRCSWCPCSPRGGIILFTRLCAEVQKEKSHLNSLQSHTSDNGTGRLYVVWLFLLTLSAWRRFSKSV
jgi:hypothetical protein